jgi:cell division septation protein DedD
VSAQQRPPKTNGLRGWFSMLTIGAIVVSAGLAVGLVAGVTWEEPGLVIGWLTGETDGIEWGIDEREVAESTRILDGVLANEGPNGLRDVAAAPPLGGSAFEATPSGGRPSQPTSTNVIRKDSQSASSPPPVHPDSRQTAVTTSETGKFAVQVGAFAERGGAEKLSASLRKAGYKVYLSDSRQGARWRVRVGPHANRAAAENTAKRLEAKQRLKTWVLREDS